MTFRTVALALAFGVAALPAAPAFGDPSPAPSPSARLTVGLQPASATAPDPRANFGYTMGPGQVRQDHIAVFNYSTTPVTLRLAARDVVTTPSGSLDVAETARDAGAWVALARRTLRLPARTRRIVAFQVGTPYNATPGDHTGAVVATLVTNSSGAAGRVEVQNRIALRLNVRVTGAVTPRLEMTGLRARYVSASRAGRRGTVLVTFALRNTGNVRLGARERIVVADLAGRVRATKELTDPLVLLPGAVVPVSARVGIAALSRMRAVVTVTPVRPAGETWPEPPAITRAVTFWAMPWPVLGLGLGVLVAAAGWRGYRRVRPRRLARHRRARGAEKILVGAPVLLAVVALLSARPAYAGSAGPWQATVSPRSGSDDSPIELATTGGCPVRATNIVARVFGAGFPAEGANVVGNTAANVRADARFEVPLVLTMRDVAQQQPSRVTLRGRYRIDVVCRTARDPEPLGVYSAAIVFSSPTAWHADKPITAAKGPVDPTATRAPGTGDGQPRANGAAPGTGGSAAPGAGPSGNQGAAGAGGKRSAGAAAPGSSAATSFLFVAFAGAAASGAFVAGRRRGTRLSPEGNARS